MLTYPRMNDELYNIQLAPFSGKIWSSYDTSFHGQVIISRSGVDCAMGNWIYRSASLSIGVLRLTDIKCQGFFHSWVWFGQCWGSFGKCPTRTVEDGDFPLRKTFKDVTSGVIASSWVEYPGLSQDNRSTTRLRGSHPNHDHNWRSTRLG